MKKFPSPSVVYQLDFIIRSTLLLIFEKVFGQQNKCDYGAKYWKLFSASGFHGMDFIIVDACCENPAGTKVIELNSNRCLVSRQVNSYDEFGNEIEEALYSENDILVRRKVMQYRAANLVSMEYHFPDKPDINTTTYINRLVK